MTPVLSGRTKHKDVVRPWVGWLFRGAAHRRAFILGAKGRPCTAHALHATFKLGSPPPEEPPGTPLPNAPTFRSSKLPYLKTSASYLPFT